MPGNVRTTVKTATAVLTEEEEKVYRMSRGVAPGDSEELGIKAADNQMAQARVLEFERALHARLRAGAGAAEDSPVKSKIIASLKSRK
jgi:hypothetical protein